MRSGNSNSHSDRAVLYYAIIFGLTGLAIVVAVLSQSAAGFDFSDEGFYLNWMAHPFDYRWSLSHFGYVYRPLYLAVSGNVAALRLSNLVILLACSWLFFSRLLHQFWPGQMGRWKLAFIAFAYSPAVWLYLDTWLPTPNYNTLALTALLLSGFAALGIHRSESPNWLDAALLGISGTLAFLAKPTCGAALGGLILVYALLRGDVRWSRLIVSGMFAMAGLLTATLLIDGAPTAFVHRIQLGLADLHMMEGGYKTTDLLRLDLPPFNKSLLVIFIVVGIYSGCILISWRVRFGRTQQIFEGLVFVILAAAAVYTGLHLEVQGWTTPAVVMLALPFAVIVTLACRLKGQRLNRAQVAEGALLLFFPLVYTTGTNNNLWWAASKAGVFWVAGAIALLALQRPLPVLALVRTAGASQLVCLLVLVHSASHPYRQTAPVYSMNEVVILDGGRSGLRLSSDAAQYVRKLQQAAHEAGFVTGMPILDLTGHHPGAVFCLGGRSIGRAWMIGSYAGRDSLARAVINRVDRDQLARSWILTEEGGPQHISSTALETKGLTLERDFVRVATLPSPIGTYPTHFEQTLYAPQRKN